MGTKQLNDKTTHRQQAKHSVKTGFLWEWENRIPGLFQDFFIFQGLNFFPILYDTTFKSALFQPEASNSQVRFPLAARKISVSKHAFSSVICRDDAR